MATLSVENDGPPIRPDDAERIFLRGFRGSTRGNLGNPGHGLGLYLARLILEAHGGTVYLDRSELSRTRFVVELPFEY
jgi:signal transduction histidine kinase